jgi:hypothetical protein
MHLHFTAWDDPVVDQRGFPGLSLYADLFWLPIIGPSSLALFRRVNVHLRPNEHACEFRFEVLSSALGLGRGASKNAPLPRAIDRCVRFGLAKRTGANSFAVRRFVSPISRHHLSLLPPELQELHDSYLAAATTPATAPAPAPTAPTQLPGTSLDSV